jgi:DNA-binding transcriptional LysR family regulator
MRDLRFDDMQLFARVAQLGSLSSVARERDVPVSQVSRRLSHIEKTCGARLIHRSTHGLSLTAEGLSFLGYCERAASTLDELEGEFASKSAGASGLVRVAASSVIAQQLLVPSLSGLNQLHPRVRIDLQVSDVLADMARDAIDIAIRSASALPDTVVARQIGSIRRTLYAAPSYLAAMGTPIQPDELHQHRLIGNSAAVLMNHWPLNIKGKKQVFVAQGHWQSNDTSIVASMVLQGLGIALLSSTAAQPLVRQKLLVPVLADCIHTDPVPIYAVTATRRDRLPKIKACLDYWAQWFEAQSVA